MPRNGSGTYTLPAGNPVVTGTTISSTVQNNTTSDIATALTNSIAKDGQTTPTANLPMGGFKHTGTAVAASTTDYARADQVQNSSLQYLTSVSGVDTITAAAPLTLAAYATGQKFRFISAGANTGAATLNINSIGAKSITKLGATALAAGDIPSGAIVEVLYDGTQFQLCNLAAQSSITATTAVTQSPNDNSTKIATTAYVDTAINVEYNRFINGAMAVDQRNSGAAQTFTAAAALAYSVDRWYGYCTGANVTGQRVAGTTPNQYNYRFTGAASVTKIGFAQRIEASDSQDLAGDTATLSVDLANSVLTSVTWTAWYANTENTFGSLSSPTRTQIATGTFTVTSTLTRYSTSISVPSAATTGIEVEFSVGAQTSGTWTIGRAQLIKGTITSFRPRPISQEVDMCQRYYERGSNLTNATPDQSFRASYSGATDWPVRYATQKRTAASVTVYSPSTQAADRWRDASAGADVVATVPTNTVSGFITQATTVDANSYNFTWQASSEL